MKRWSILVIDDDISFLHSIKELLELYDYEVFTSDSGKNIEQLLQDHLPDLILLDLVMPEIDGLQLLKRINFLTSLIPTIMISGEGEIKQAVAALKLGAFDFIEKGVEVNVIIETVKNGLIKREYLLKRKPETDDASQPQIIAESPKMLSLLNMAEKIAPNDMPVLITGESGTGKELLAHKLHSANARSGHNLVSINCANLLENLLESELFGYKKGAFTGADRNYKGKIAEAHNGTLFLDEIGELPLRLQSKLLRILEENQFTPLGDNKPVKVNFRLIAATNRDLPTMVKQKTFRKDVFFRINSYHLHIPPLNERKEDIKPLLNHFLNTASLKNKKNVHYVTDDALEILYKYNWPGNVRELKNLAENLVIFSHGEVINYNTLKETLADALPHHPLNHLFS